MQSYSEVVTDNRGRAVSGATVRVKSGGTTATIYSDNGVTTKANPTTTDATGYFSFYAANGSYTIDITAGTGPTKTVPAVLFDAADAGFSASDGSSHIGFLQSGTGAVARTAQDKHRERVSVLDFYANGVSGVAVDPTGVVDSTLGIQAALNSVTTSSGAFGVQTKRRGGRIYIPAGKYRITATLTGLPGTSVIGDGYESTILINETASGDVLSFTGAEGGTVDYVELDGFSVAQKSGVSHSSGYAIKIDGNSYGTTPRIKNVFTYGTAGGLYLDWCYPGTLIGVHAFSHVTGFTTRLNCTSTTFQNCYAGACSGSGFKIAGHYIALLNCASDSNTLDGYELYYDSGSSTGISLVSCGSESFSRNGVSVDRASGVSIITPRLIASASGLSALKLDGAAGIVVMSPVLSALAANANAAVDISSASGAYPTNVQLLGWSGLATNYASAVSQPDYVFHPGSRTDVGMYAGALRLGGITNFTRALQIFQIGNNFPAGATGTVYGANYVPVATEAMTFAAVSHYKPVVNAPTFTIGRLIAGPFVEAPTITAGTVTRHEGSRIADQPAGATADANLVIGDAALAAGRWSIYNISARTNVFGGPIQWGSSAGPIDTFGAGSPEGVVTAAIGSTYRRTDGGAATAVYFKESGTGNTGWVGK